MRKDVYQLNYERMEKLGLLNITEHKILESPGFMPLNVEVIARNEKEGTITYSLMHYYRQNGDLMRDPEMEIKVYPSLKMAEALTFRQDCFPSVFCEVYPEPGLINVAMKGQLNKFLGQWLRNIKAQRFQYTEPVRGEV